MKTSTKKFTTPRISHSSTSVPIWVLPVGLFVLAIAMWFVFDYGRYSAGFDSAAHTEVQVELMEKITQLEEEREQLRIEAAKNQSSASIDKSSVAFVQTEITKLQSEKAALQKRVDFLESLVSKRDPHFKVVDFTLRQRDGVNTYRYGFTVSKMAKGNRTIKGSVYVTVHGQQDGEKKKLALSKLTSGKVKSHRLGFKHFQAIEGDLTLPAGFIPKSFVIEVNPSVNSYKKMNKTFDWDLS